MTSTVLDVTVLLLCVSASVVALGAAEGDSSDAGPQAGEVADLIATETVTVTYGSDEAPNGTRTIHATRAELLALVAVGGGGDGERRASREAFESEALSAIKRGVGPRTRIDAEVETRASGEIGDESENGSTAYPRDAGNGPPHRRSNASAPLTGPGGRRFGSEGVDRGPAGATGTGPPWRVERGHHGSGSAETEAPAAESESPEPVKVGIEPPRGADVTVAVTTHPAPRGAEWTGSVRIVIRRW